MFARQLWGYKLALEKECRQLFGESIALDGSIPYDKLRENMKLSEVTGQLFWLQVGREFPKANSYPAIAIKENWTLVGRAHKEDTDVVKVAQELITRLFAGS